MLSNMQDTNKVMLKKLKINTKLLYSGIGKLNNPNALSQDKMNSSSFIIRRLLLQGETNNLRLSSQWQIRGYSSNNQPLPLCDRIKIPKLHKQFKVCLLLHQHLLTVCWLGDPDLDKEPRLCVCVEELQPASENHDVDLVWRPARCLLTGTQRSCEQL